MPHRLKALSQWFELDPGRTLEQQFFRGLCLVAGLTALFIVLPVNAFQDMSPWVARIILGIGLVSLALAWAAHRGLYLTKTLLFAYVLGLDLLWFPNGGSQGSVPLYFFIATLYLVVFFQGLFRYLGIALVIVNIIGLHALELKWPGLPRPFVTPVDRFLDLSSGYLVSLLVSAMILWVILRGFQEERRRLGKSLADRLHSEHALAVSEAQMKAIFDSTRDFIWSVDVENFALLTFNASLRDHFLRERGIALRPGIRQDELFPPGQTLEYWVEAFRRALREGTYAEDYVSHPSNNRLNLTFTLLKREGEVFAIAVFGHDITEHTRLEEERKALEGHLHQIEKMESLGALAGGVAHDINNVLGAILGLASTHLLKAEHDPLLARDMRTITMACQRGGTLVKGLLSFARKSLAEEREVDLNELVREEVALLERTTLQRIRLATELTQDLRPMRGDPAALSHALMNLCVNAVDAMPGGGALTLRTRKGPEDTVLVEVEDTGSGMPAEVLERALEPFFTTKPQGHGTGLGLSMVYATVKAHDGRMELHSEPGAGTRITLSFPTHLGEAAEAEAGDEPVFKPSLAPLHVLLVDDDEFIRESMEAVLEVLGHTAAIARGGEEALAKLTAGLEPDLVIMDMNMPGMDGAETLPRLRDLNPTVPVLLATGRVDRIVLDLIEAHPKVALLSKPFDIKELQRKLDAILPAI